MKIEVNIPNILSGMRILLTPLIFLLILNSSTRNFKFLLAVFFLSVLLDFFDGFLARKLAQETEFGKALDPVADKFMIFFIVLALIIKSNFPIWLAMFIFVRDFSILLASLKLLEGRKKKIKSSLLVGKITFAFLGALILVFLVDLHQGARLEALKRFFIVICTGLLVWSSFQYYGIYQRERKNGK